MPLWDLAQDGAQVAQAGECGRPQSHTAHRLQKMLNDAQEALGGYLRTHLRLPLDDLLAVIKEFLEPDMSHSTVDRMLRRHGVSRLSDLESEAAIRTPVKAFKAYGPGFVHIDVKYLPQMQDEDRRRYALVAIERATRWVHVRLRKDKSPVLPRRFLESLEKAAPFQIRTILSNNGKEFTDRFFASRERAASGKHEFDALCAELGSEDRLTSVRRPQTNGMVERFNGRIAEVLRTHRFQSGADLEATLKRYVWLYNQQLPQKALNHESPIQAMKKWAKHIRSSFGVE